MIRDFREDALRDFVAAYVSDLIRIGRPALIEAHDAPYDSLFFGVAGTAYACWRVGTRIGDATLVETGSSLIAEARGSFSAGELGLDDPAGSLFFGPPGVAYVRALMESGEAGLAGDGALPLLDGVAGRLVAAARLGSRETAGRLAATLVDAAPWTLPGSGVAHGRGGLYLALLLSGRPLPDWFFPTLSALEPEHEDGTWCRGLAGFVMLYAHAYRATEDRRWLERGRAAAQLVYDRAGGPPDLCCGAAGAAYALLSLDALDGGAWRERAVDLALRSITSESASRWPHALFRGDAGLLCLAVDLLEGGGGMPCVED